MTGVAVTEAVRKEAGLSPLIKWPNDILINDRKVAGILLESKAARGHLEYAVIGIGVNVNNQPADLAQEFRLEASSLAIEAGEPIPRSRVLTRILVQFEALYGKLQGGDSAAILKEWRRFSETLGEYVRVRQGKRLIEGLAVDVDEDGSLLMRTENKSLINLYGGEVERLRRVQAPADS
jgi:BirA family biotin operon repressor/biotin-[acetyl-CoA-carboxylase] ligase